MTALETFRLHYNDRDRAARQWKAAGGRVVGYVADNVPEELIAAAGFLPYRLSGDPDAGFDALQQYLFPFYPKYTTSFRQLELEFVNSIMQLLFAGRYDFVDYLVVPNARKAILSIHAHLREAKAFYPDLNLPETYVLDRTMTGYFDAAVFNRRKIVQLKAQLEAWSGKAIGDGDLSRAIALGNEGRALLQQVVAMRAEAKISGVDALAIFGSSKLMPCKQHNDLLREFLASAQQFASRPGPRLFVGGSPLDNSELYALIESCGATIVGENHYWGNRCSEHPIRDDVAPLDAIADRHHKVPTDIQYPLSASIDQCAVRAAASKAQGAVFNVYRLDDHQGWDAPDEMRALKEQGIPSLYLAEQPYKISEPDALRRRIGEFVASLN
jgi:benzoyl-CoA reductase/2-hydroxyglutaryl-CoA dehydratase subunit BcrC/BadD/HgdB